MYQIIAKVKVKAVCPCLKLCVKKSLSKHRYTFTVSSPKVQLTSATQGGSVFAT